MFVKNLIGLIVVLFVTSAVAQTPNTDNKDYSGYLLAEILDAVSNKIGKSIFLDPRVDQYETAMVFGKQVQELEFSDLLRILDLHGYTAYEVDGALNVIKENEIRSDSLPTVTEGQNYDPHQYVSKVVSLNKLCVAQALPVLRPLVAQGAHISAMVNGNSLIFVDKYANIQRIEHIVNEIENSMDKKQKCEPLPRKS